MDSTGRITDQRHPARAPQPQRTAWGRSARLGGGSGRLMAVSLLLGVIGGAALAFGAAAVGRAVRSDLPAGWDWLFPVVFSAFTIPLLTAVAWALLVDRSTLRGAADRPEESIESRWYDRAAQSTFHVMLLALGVGSGAAALTGWQADTDLLLLALALLMGAVFTVSYLLAKRAES